MLTGFCKLLGLIIYVVPLLSRGPYIGKYPPPPPPPGEYQPMSFGGENMKRWERKRVKCKRKRKKGERKRKKEERK
jgi:hypothetical protein